MSGRAPTTWHRWPHCITCPVGMPAAAPSGNISTATRASTEVSTLWLNKALLDAPQARDGALLEVGELRHEVADLRRMASPHKALRMSRSDSEDEDPLAEQVRDTGTGTPHR